LANLFVIVGLGNPGQKYAETRHNAGFWFLDKLVSRIATSFRPQSKLLADVAKGELHGRECILVKPFTHMNHSGQSVRAVLDYYKMSVNQMLVAYDDLDLPPGAARLKFGGGHGGHNGLRDIFRHIQSPDFLRLRIGIGHPGLKEQVTPYVLSRPQLEEQVCIDRAIDAAEEVLDTILSDDLVKAQTRLHTATKEFER
jgi:PTH1 family peptidyl-tRNA hydrolase